MNSKVTALALASILCFSLAACGGGEAQSPTPDAPQPTPTQSGPQATQPLDSLDGLDVEHNIFSVEITVPAAFAGEDMTQESLDETVSEKGFKSATLNEDGSVTYVMTKEQHNDLMDEMRGNIETSLSEMIDPATYPSFKTITANSDFTEFTVEITTTELDLSESFSVLAFYMYGGIYHAFNGTQADDIVVKFVNVQSGNIVQESHSRDMAK